MAPVSSAETIESLDLSDEANLRHVMDLLVDSEVGDVELRNEAIVFLKRAATASNCQTIYCSSADANNPFITQWVILAVRNLYIDNSENQVHKMLS